MEESPVAVVGEDARATVGTATASTAGVSAGVMEGTDSLKKLEIISLHC